MKYWIIFLFSFPILAMPTQDYFDLLENYSKTIGVLGNYEKEEIEIVTSEHEIEEIEEIALSRLTKKGHSLAQSKEWSRVGIVAEDQYLYWIRDAVIFPSGAKGTYDRILWKSGIDGAPGIAILPYLTDRKIIVNVNYRHATRSWEIELPRGLRRSGETLRGAATRELKEETGYQLDETLLLGSLAVDSGILTSLIPVFACKAHTPSENNPDYSEAISKNLVLSSREIEEALLQGFWNTTIGDKVVRANVRDPFLAYGLLHMKLRHWQE
ncbi:MAG: NUDIX hydrolase [Simkaniaceae bacterium]|jgi:ADP-ribose pyrophosphatase|nr:MAG: NUDIX hydrolase [Simkaniaceae bacterium]